MLKSTLLAIAIFVSLAAFSQQSAPYNPAIDVQHYAFHIGVSDANDSVRGRAIITVRFTEKTNKVRFDLVNVNDTGRGMIVTEVKENDHPASFTHLGDVVTIQLSKESTPNETRRFEITYAGIPADGLIISQNKFKHRTMFADNWPNRAHYWIPCKDHISDKAAVDFFVTAPEHYQVISNGVKLEDNMISGKERLTHWKEEVPLPTKIMVIGIADFAVQVTGTTNGIPVSSWIFPELRDKGFADYAQAVEILPFYIQHVGPYSYKKLANVQSKTIFGGMENASAIFYFENSVNGERKNESLLAHEIAHQWFGDAATEIDWPHFWLSEGFATEMTHLYLESKYGKDSIAKEMEKDRKSVIAFTRRTKLPVVDTVSKNLMQLLNTNSYQKGGWVLHMLRQQLGDTVFWKSVQDYYAAYRGKNASTNDLQKIFETVSGKNLQTFFDQWLRTGENPLLDISWSYDSASQKISLTIVQQNTRVFEFPIEIQAGAEIHTINVNQKTTQVFFPAKSKPLKIIPDPHVKLLFEAVVKAQ